MRNYPRQMFLITRDLIDAVSIEELDATAEAMKEVGVYRPPYDSFTISTPMMDFVRLVNWQGEIVEGGINPGERMDFTFDGDALNISLPPAPQLKPCDDFPAKLREMGKYHPFVDVEAEIVSLNKVAEFVKKALIVLLATKNVEKTTVHNKLAKFNRGHLRAHYTTTLKIGRVTENSEGDHAETGQTRRPHLRRGHVRQQHYGPKNAFTKAIFIEPVFVNADENWINARTAYNVNVVHA